MQNHQFLDNEVFSLLLPKGHNIFKINLLYYLSIKFSIIVVNENVSMPSAPPPTQPRQKPTEPLPISPFPVIVDIYQSKLEDNESTCEITKWVIPDLINTNELEYQFWSTWWLNFPAIFAILLKKVSCALCKPSYFMHWLSILQPLPKAIHYNTCLLQSTSSLTHQKVDYKKCFVQNNPYFSLFTQKST